MTSILLVCRANLCRSPSAEVMLSRALAGAGVDASVSSAGLEVVEGQVAPEDFVEIALVRGIDLRAHRPTSFSKDVAEQTGLVLAMTRSLLRTMVLGAPSIWPRSFTLLEVVRRGTSTTPPVAGESMAGWLSRVHASRDRAELDVSRPHRRPARPHGRRDRVERGDVRRARARDTSAGATALDRQWLSDQV